MNKKLSILSGLLFTLSSCEIDIVFNSSTSISENESIESIDSFSSKEDIFSEDLFSENSIDDNTSSENSIYSSEKINDKQELLIDNDFSSLSNWTIFNENGQKLNVISSGNNELKLNVNNNGANNNWSCQVLQNGLLLKENCTYDISFDIISNVSRDIQFLIQQDTNYDPVPFNQIYSLKANEKLSVKDTVSITYTSTYLFGFMLGNVNGTLVNDHTISISNVSLFGEKEKVNSSTGLDGTYDSAPTTKYGKTLSWSDEFNGTKLDTSKWSYEIGTGSWGWGNNEKQYYTSNESNCSVNNGSLKITALKEKYGNCEYTSSRIRTKGKYETIFGYIEARMALPSMSGIWPAFWMLGADIDSNPWPHCGEIDIMEAINYNNSIYSTLHWNQGNQTNHASSGTSAIDVGDRTEYHTYGFLWTETEMRFYHDDELHYVFDMTINSSLDVFKTNNFYFLFNVAVGGNWPGFNIGDNFPMTMSIDYLRVYQ